jgi:hypothetical protein
LPSTEPGLQADSFFSYTPESRNGLQRHGGPFSRSSSGAGGSTGVPEPGTLALFGLGFLGLGLARRRRRSYSSKGYFTTFS